jgi:hypothetical protein
MNPIIETFERRARVIPDHGLGLSVDLYSPDLFDLIQALETEAGDAGAPCGYLEIFKAAEQGLAWVRQRVPGLSVNYHAEGLWVTQPDMATAYPWEGELESAARHLRMLGSHWLTHECASKQMAGYSFGTYLPPVYTRAAAAAVARNVDCVQRALDRRLGGGEGQGPLLLLEMPPLTYFAFGDLPVPEFFRLVAEATPCGLVLDIGHLWTVSRYTGAWRSQSLEEFVQTFLERFPLDRVIQIHVAGLAVHETIGLAPSNQGAECSVPVPVFGADGAPVPRREPPWWIDAHGAPIPDVLFDMLEQVLAHPGLANLKGIALEVDTKSIPEIVREFGAFRRRFARWAERSGPVGIGGNTSAVTAARPDARLSADHEAGADLAHLYADYARAAAGVDREAIRRLPALGIQPGTIEAYRTYLRHEILAWGGALTDMFPQTCKALERAGVTLGEFVAFWFREARPVTTPYDFFLLKVERFLEFVGETLLSAAALAAREADELRQAYQTANEWGLAPQSGACPPSGDETPHTRCPS